MLAKMQRVQEIAAEEKVEQQKLNNMMKTKK